jgi:hypothetical protein
MVRSPSPRNRARRTVAAAAVIVVAGGVVLLAVADLSTPTGHGSSGGPRAHGHRSAVTEAGRTKKDCLGTTGRGSASFAALDTCGYPSPNTTGVPVGTRLRPVSSINCTNTTVDAVSTSGPVTIGSGCTITNSRIIGAVVVRDGVTGVKLTNDEISGPYTGTPLSPTCTYDPKSGDGGATSAVTGEGVASALTLDHDYLHCAAEPFNGNGIVTNSYLIADECWGPCGNNKTTTHNEAIYIAGGGSGGTDIEHNTILNPWPQTAGIFGDDHSWGPIQNLTINDNLVAAGGDNGAITVGCKGDHNSNVNITNNRLSFIYDRSMPTGGYGGGSWSGNVRDDTGATVSANC